MRDDPPTMPGLAWGNTDGHLSGGAPTWPPVPQLPAAPAPPTGGRQPVILVMSLVANGALLACSLMLIVLARAGAITPPASSGQPHALGLAVGSPTPTLSPTPGSGSLQVAPTSVELRCGNGQQVQYVVLRNTGTEDVQWQVGFAGSDQPGISVNPNNGDLRAGTSIPLLLQIRKRASDQQGTVSFNAGSSDNGSSEAPASLSYTISGCSSG